MPSARSIDSIAKAKPYPLWWDQIPRKPTRPPLGEAIAVDVAIVGGGFTGLWTSYYLAVRNPELTIAVLERDFIGYGASGRNGGWCYAGFASDLEKIEQLSNTETARRWGRVLIDALDEINRVVDEEGIDCDWQRGGTIHLFRNGGQKARAEEHVASVHRLGWTDADARLLSLGETNERIRATRSIGAEFSPHNAAIHPAKLVAGLATAAERRGVTIYENTEATGIEAGVVATNRATVSAPIVIRATEGYTAEIDGHERELAPLYSLMLATEPLSDAAWNQIGLDDRETFGDYRHMVIYGQRTADGRIAFGGRGAPYDFGSRIRRGAEFSPDHHVSLWGTLTELFPVLEGTRVSHRWGGVLGVARDWTPRVAFDELSGLGWAGGYVGSGALPTNLAGRTLTDLIMGDKTDLTSYPWVNLPVRRWEPEPFRWLGIMGAQRAMEAADFTESRTNQSSRVASGLWRMIDL
ncbi:MAG: FAD-binding oxidoreductase [Acidimicrobiia bacterium]|nr:FAD-binding oxidoreductase [Acidimicrobiia bacterium]NNC43343.1 FAD-dependent oxidoreductase [Acidimicrobiia bacterium]NND14421.1 FAD-dependent oxidoreductase [Acidimicrobiia bacterium]